MNNKKEKKKYVKISFKLSFLIIASLLVMSSVMNYSSLSRQKRITIELYRHEMVTTASMLQNLLDSVDGGDYTNKDDTYYKGDTALSSIQDRLETIGKESGVNISMFYGTDVMTSSDTSQTSPIDESTLKQLESSGSFYKNSVKMGDTNYFCYYSQLKQPSTGEVIGALCVNTPRTAIDKRLASARSITMAISTFAIISIFIGAYFMLNRITKALSAVTKGLLQVAEGDLNISLNEKYRNSNDEIGDISTSLLKVRDSLSSMLEKINSTAENISEFSTTFSQSFDQINENIEYCDTAVEAIAQGATSQAQETQSANSDIANISSTIEQTSSNIKSLDQRSQTMKDYSTSAQETLDALISINSQTTSSFATVKEMSDATNRSVKEIGTALNTITDIASQTNLLALNASIEAARAGEAGKGFAVVADEIRNLAEQSADMVKKIEEITKELTYNSTQSVTVIDDVAEVVTTQNEKLSETSDYFKDLIQEVAYVIEDISAIEKQTRTLTQLESTLISKTDSLSTIAEENAAYTEETSATVTTLRSIIESCNQETTKMIQLASSLKEQMNKFILDNN